MIPLHDDPDVLTLPAEWEWYRYRYGRRMVQVEGVDKQDVVTYRATGETRRRYDYLADFQNLFIHAPAQ